jgi:hypothetical protein
MKTTIRAQRIALDFCKSDHSGPRFKTPEMRDELAGAIFKFLNAATENTEDRVESMQIALLQVGARGKKLDSGTHLAMILEKAQDVLEWKPKDAFRPPDPDHPILNRKRGRPRKLRK